MATFAFWITCYSCTPLHMLSQAVDVPRVMSPSNCLADLMFTTIQSFQDKKFIMSFHAEFFFDSLVTNFPIEAVVWAEPLEQPASLDTWYQLPLIESHTKCTRYEFPHKIHIIPDWKITLQTTRRHSMWRPVSAADTVITLWPESFVNWQKVNNSSSLKQDVSGTLYIVLHPQIAGLWYGMETRIENKFTFLDEKEKWCLLQHQQTYWSHYGSFLHLPQLHHNFVNLITVFSCSFSSRWDITSTCPHIFQGEKHLSFVE